jgi:hypothetical protein
MQGGWQLVLVATALTALAGCMTERGGGAASVPAARPAAAPPPDLAGRWTLSAAPGGACAMNLGPASQGGEGSIRPEGGCPGNFYTSRRWTFENNELVIRDHNSAPLGQLRLAAPGRFEGQSANGQPVSLVR